MIYGRGQNKLVKGVERKRGQGMRGGFKVVRWQERWIEDEECCGTLMRERVMRGLKSDGMDMVINGDPQVLFAYAELRFPKVHL